MVIQDQKPQLHVIQISILYPLLIFQRSILWCKVWCKKENAPDAHTCQNRRVYRRRVHIFLETSGYTADVCTSAARAFRHASVPPDPNLLNGNPRPEGFRGKMIFLLGIFERRFLQHLLDNTVICP